MSNETYDIIFAGGGTVACITAGRLARLDPSLKILLIEKGSHTNRGLDDILFRQPARCFYNLFFKGHNVDVFTGEPDVALDGRQPVSRVGRCVGGSSGINFLMYSRAAASDYDDWEKAGNPGWGSKDLIPLACKAETFEGFAENAPNHGASGLVHVSKGGYETNIGEAFIEAAKGYFPEKQPALDTSDFLSSDRYGKWNKYIDKQTGHRSDTAHSYIYNLSGIEKVDVLTGQQVSRVIMEGTKAVGVEVMGASNKDAVSSRFYASKLVIVSGGAFGSPAILERSGIGSSAILKEFDIEQVVDLPGVGTNYIDHIAEFLPFYGNDETDFMGPIFVGDDQAVEEHVMHWKEKGLGQMATNGIDAGIRLRPTEKELPSFGPEFKSFWDEVMAPNPDKPLHQLGAFAGCFPTPAVPGRNHFCTFWFSEYSLGRGSVHIKSTDPSVPPTWHSGFLAEPWDAASARYGYKKAIEVARRMRFFQGAVPGGHPPFRKGGPAETALSATCPVSGDAPDIAYDEDDDKVLDAFHRANVVSAYHSLGTCPMKPRENGGVLDPRLNVHGTQNLKVADLSICPGNITANPYNTALMVGEKAALIIAEDLGIKA